MRTFACSPLALCICATALLGTAAWSQEDPPQTPDDKQFQAVAERYWKILERRPRRDTAFDLWYRHYLDAGKLDELTKRVQEHAAEKPSDSGAQLLLGLVEERRGNEEQALAAYSKAEELAADNYYPVMLKATVLARHQRPEEAAAALAKAISLDPPRSEQLELYKRLGRLQLQQQKTAEALQTFATMAEAFPGDRQVLEELAQLLTEERQYDEALKRWEQLAALAADDPYQQLQARVEIAQLKIALGQRQEAVQLLETSLDQAKPESWLERDIRRRIEQAFLQSEDLTGLVAWCQQRLERRPQDLATMVQLATALRQSGKPTEALVHYQRAVELAPSRQDLRQALIDALVATDKLPGAIAQCEILSRQQPDDPEVLRRLGELHLEAARDTELPEAERKAIEIWKKIAVIGPQDARLALQVAEICRQAEQQNKYRRPGSRRADSDDDAVSPLLATAEEYYRVAVGRAPTEPQYREYLGEFLHSQDRSAEAIEAWKAIATTPEETAQSWHRLAEVYAGFDYLEEAVAASEQAIARKSNDFALHDFRLGLLIKQKNYPAALVEADHLDRLAAGEAATERAIKRRVEVYSAANQVEQQIARLQRLTAKGEATINGQWLLAMLLVDRWKFAEAARQLEAALSKEPDHVTLLATYADALKRSGDLTRAVAQYRRLAELDARSRFSYYQEIIQLELQRNNPAGAKEAADQLVKLSPGSLEGYRVRAAVAFRLKDYEEGFRNLRQAVKIAPRDVDVRSQLARALAERGQREEALEHYWRCFELADELSGKLPLVAAMAEVASRSQKSDELIDKLRRLRMRQDDPKVLTMCLNEALVRMKRYDDAQRELVALLDDRGEDPDVLRQLTALAERQRAWPAAIGYMERLVALDDSRTNLERLAHLLSENGNAEASARIWQRMLEEAKDDTVAAAVVDRQLQEGRIHDAVALAELHLAKDPQSWRMLLRAGYAHIALDEKDKAKASYEALLNLEEPPAEAQSSLNNPSSVALPPPAAVPAPVVGAVTPGAAAATSSFGSRVPASYAMTSASALQRIPSFAATFPQTQELNAAREMLMRLTVAQQVGARPTATARPGAPVPRVATPARPTTVLSPSRQATATRTATQRRLMAVFAGDADQARLEAMVALHYLAMRQGVHQKWYEEELKLGKADPRRLRRAVLACSTNIVAQQALGAILLATLIEARPDDPLPHLVRLHSPSTIRVTPAQSTVITEKERLVADAKESFAWLVRRQPEAEKDLSYYFVVRLNALGAAAEAAEVVDAQLKAAQEFDDLGALPMLILGSGNDTLIRQFFERSAELAAEPKLSATAAPYLSMLLEYSLVKGSFTGEADITRLVLLFDRYLSLDDTRSGQLASPQFATVRSASGQQVVVMQQPSGQLTVVQSPTGPVVFSQPVPANASQQGRALLQQLRTEEQRLATLRAQNASATQIKAYTQRYESIRAQLARLGIEVEEFPEANSYLDEQRFQLLQRFAKALKQKERHSVLLERLAKSAESQEGALRARYQLAGVFTLWWTGEKPAALAMLERLCQENAHDQVLAITLAQAYYSENEIRRALAIVERLKNPDPAVAQQADRLRQEIRRRYSDLARLRDLKGHTHVVRSIAFSPDGKQLLTGSYDRSLRVWDVESGKFLKNLAGHTDLVLCVAWSPAGQRVASGSYDEIRIWDVSTSQCLHAIQSAGGAIRSLCFSPDGKSLVSAGDDRIVRLWSVESGSEIARFEGHTERVFSTVFSPDGKMLASAGGDRSVRLWDLESRKPIDVLTGHSNSISSVAFAPDGKSIASASDDNNIMLWRLPAGKAYATLQRHTDSVFSVAFSPDGKYLASGGADHSIKLWNLADIRDEPATLMGHSNTVASVCFSSDGKTLASAGYDEAVKLWTLLARDKPDPAQADSTLPRGP